MAKAMTQKRPRTGQTVTAQKWMAVTQNADNPTRLSIECVFPAKTAIRQWLRDKAPAGEYAIHAVTDSGIIVTEEPTVKRTVGKKAVAAPFVESIENQPNPVE